MIRRPPRSTQSRSSAASDVYKRQDKSVWKKIKSEFFNQLKKIYRLLRNSNVSYQAISEIMKLIFPQSKGMVFRGFIESMEEVEIPENGKAYVSLSLIHI